MTAYCYRCDRSFRGDRALQQHRYNSGNHFNHQCPVCGTSFDEEDDLEEHIDDEHYRCDGCDKVCRTLNGLRQHENVHTPQYDCDKCNRSFWSQNELNMHEQTHARKIKCRFCERMFPNHSAMVLHLESGTCSSGINRRRINEYVRAVDKNNAITKNLLTYVETIATEASWDRHTQSYLCFLCSRSFRQLSSLNNHLASPAHEAKQFFCPQRGCGKEHTCLSGLVQHIEFGNCGFGASVMRKFIDSVGTGRRLLLG